LELLRFDKSGDIKGVETIKRPQRVKLSKDSKRRLEVITNSIMHRSKTMLFGRIHGFILGLIRKKTRSF
jgi:predicted metalloprotease